ncbi:GHKL domain-containing protein [Shewanella eurypsychrophilus]|uniref:histidine kinase n=1 Tax=Shewanella eurypsychrophilus TaxID=2593656 RepID=A0ABX6VAU1_9GAMM|nr:MULTISPECIES: ATP-binding protein [Shewanella]QFU23786.1 GHKL domain-containing protein [Shewanella sp. YLB-09]QPG59009.1 GHKL domain-containing protein [Shewanella eurypsychrophilus]
MLSKLSSLTNSLKARLIISALLLILVLLPLIGFTLNDAFKQQVSASAKNELKAYLYSILAVTEIDNGQLLMPEALADNQFNVIQSGLFALISTPSPDKKTTSVTWQSNSFLGLDLPDNLPQPEIGQSQFEEIVIDGQPHIIYSYSASFERKILSNDGLSTENIAFPITVHIIKDQLDYQAQIDLFSQHLWSWLLILMVFLVLVQLAWLLWTLKPLAQFKRELNDIEQGKATEIKANYPNELQAVAKQLNTLLNTEQSQRKRYRNALSDLAHSLKTPLAVIQSQKDLSKSSFEQTNIISRIISHQLKRAQTAAGASWHLGTAVNKVADKLVRTLPKIYREPQIAISANVDNECIFKGDEADLTEILGNLLDNACKAAKQDVQLTVTTENNKLCIIIEDDGSGISPEKQSEIFERGIRADSYQQGHGIGLAIVRDLVDSYQGQLSVSSSERLGGAKFKLEFNT